MANDIKCASYMYKQKSTIILYGLRLLRRGTRARGASAAGALPVNSQRRTGSLARSDHHADEGQQVERDQNSGGDRSPGWQAIGAERNEHDGSLRWVAVKFLFRALSRASETPTMFNRPNFWGGSRGLERGSDGSVQDSSLRASGSPAGTKGNER